MMVSIVLLTWNRCRFLERCLSSLFTSLSGKFDYEFLVLDNGSTDSTAGVLDSFKRQYPGLVVFNKPKNQGLNAYKILFKRAKGDVIIEVDDDILNFPKSFDETIVDYLSAYGDYGFLALNVIQDEHTNGAKPTASQYIEDRRNGKVVERGPTGGWCTGFRRRDYWKVHLFFNFIPLNMKRCEDGMLTTLFRVLLHLKAGIIQKAVCLHACGPYFAAVYGQLDREIEKYRASGLLDIARSYVELKKMKVL